jgi:hypothetical protein
MKPRVIGKKYDIQNILSIGSIFVSKIVAIPNTLDAAPFFQFMHLCYLVGMQVQMFLQHCMCAAI